MTHSILSKRLHRMLTPVASCLLMTLPIGTSFAEIHPRSASYNYSQKALSSYGNSAAPAVLYERNDEHKLKDGFIDLGLGLEYGNIDNLIDLYNNLSNDFTPPEDGDDGGNGGEEGGDNGPGLGWDIDWDKVFEENPGLEDRIDAIADNVAVAAGVLALIAVEGYAKAEASAETGFVLSNDIYGGTLTFGASVKSNILGVGIFENITLDKEQAKSELERIAELTPDDPADVYDLSGGISLYYDPATKEVDLSIDNDSLLLMKTATISQLSLSYSRKAYEFEQGSLYWGIKPTYYRVGLTNLDTRIGDLTNVGDLLDKMRDSEYVYSSAFDFDLGLIWEAQNYQLGMSLNNIVENEYDYPEISRARYDSSVVNQILDRHEAYIMKRQVKVEAAIFTDDRDWQLTFDYDANAIQDPILSNYQWVTLAGDYSTNSWWLPNARIGYSKNLKGTQLSYLSLGVTVMKMLTIDLASSLDTVEIDNTDLMQGLNVRMGVQFEF